MSLNLREQQFEKDIEAFLLQEGGYLPGNQAYYLKDKALDLSELIAFISNTQPKEWARYERTYQGRADEMLYRRFQEQVDEKGLLSVLRNGIKDRGITLRFAYFAPASSKNQDLVEKYRKNLLTCHRQFAYSLDNHNTIDMVLSLNGIPIVTLELKNQFTGQSVENGKLQYASRDPRELVFQFNKRALVHFTADLTEVHMTTRLARQKTKFLPFNQGSGGAGEVGGAGNPPNPEGYATSYLWETVLKRDSLLAMLQRYLSLEVEQGKHWRTGKLLFPRYHQWDVVEKLTADVYQHGSGKNYLIQHSAGSGKSNSIAWLTYRLSSLHNKQDQELFHSVFVVTDRRVLNRQLQETILGFDHKPGLITTITDRNHSSDLRDAINDGKRIIITTLHRFPLIVEQVQHQKGKRFAVIVDEAHSSQSGIAARTLRETLADTEQALKEFAEIENLAEDGQEDSEDMLIRQLLTQGRHDNLSFFGFTATPKPKTLETFGVKREDQSYHAFHTYSMRQAIEEEFILDVFRNYTTMENSYEIVKAVPENPELPEPPTIKAIKSYQHGHQDTIAKKTAIMVEKFREITLSKLDGKAKAMVVTASRAHAVKYLLAIRDYIKANAYTDVKPLVAFSGEITIGGIKYSEPGLNTHAGQTITEAQLPKAFASDAWNLLVVAEKYQTGFSESRLHTMFVDKGLRGVKAVQTLSRLNRVYPGKVDTFILDFVNKVDDIRASFLPFYEDTFLKEGIDPNMVYTFKDRLDNLRLYNSDDVDRFYAVYLKDGPQTNTDLGKLASILQPAVTTYKEMPTEARYEARDSIRHFNRAYAYVAQIVRLFDKELHKEYLFTEYLWRLLPPDPRVTVDLLGKISLEKNRLEETFSGDIGLTAGERAGGLNPQSTQTTPRQLDKTAMLEMIIEKINLLYEGKFTDADKVIVETIYDRIAADSGTLERFAKITDPEMFAGSIFPDAFDRVARECYVEQTASFSKLFENKSFYKQVMEQMARAIYQGMRNGKTV